MAAPPCARRSSPATAGLGFHRVCVVLRSDDPDGLRRMLRDTEPIERQLDESADVVAGPIRSRSGRGAALAYLPRIKRLSRSPWNLVTAIPCAVCN